MFGGEGHSFLFSELSGSAGEIGSTVVISGGEGVQYWSENTQPFLETKFTIFIPVF